MTGSNKVNLWLLQYYILYITARGYCQKNTKGNLQTWRWYIAYKVHRLEFADMLRNFVYKGNWCKLAIVAVLTGTIKFYYPCYFFEPVI